MKDTKSFFPIHIKRADKVEYKVNDEIVIRRLDKSRFKDICGFNKCKFNDNNEVLEYTISAESRFRDEFCNIFCCDPDFTGYPISCFQIPTYVLELETSSEENNSDIFAYGGVIWNKIYLINIALSLVLVNTSTSLFWRITENRNSSEPEFKFRNLDILKDSLNHHHKEYTENLFELNEDNLEKFRLYYEKLNEYLFYNSLPQIDNYKGKLKIALDLFSSSTYFNKKYFSQPIIFLLQIIALESLLVPDYKEEGTTSKLVNRFSKLIKNGKSSTKLKKEIEELYKIRCSIAHEGKFSITDIDVLLPKAIEYSNEIICKYITNPEDFSESNLKNLYDKKSEKE